MSSKYTFHTNYGLKVDFAPLIAALKIIPINFVMQHWQAHPKFSRHFAYFEYDNMTGIYRTLPHGSVIIKASPETLQIDERVHKTVPTAVLYYPNCQLNKVGECLWRLENARSKT